MTPHQVTPTSPGTREALAFDMRPADQGHTRTELRVEAQVTIPRYGGHLA